MKILVQSIMIVTIVSLMTSCLVDSSNPVAGTSVDPTPYTGTWECVKVWDSSEGTNDPGFLKIIAATNGSLTCTTMFNGLTNVSEPLILIQVSGQVVASVSNSVSGKWRIFGVSLANGGTNLLVNLADSDLLEPDITNGVIQGVVSQISPDDYRSSLTATGEAIRDYLTTHTNVFGHNEEFLYLKKVQ